MILRLVFCAVAVGMALLGVTPGAAGQAAAGSALARARLAVALRDSVLKKGGDIKVVLAAAKVETSRVDDLAFFLKDPFDTNVVNAPSLDQLDRALALVNAMPKSAAGATAAGQQAGGIGTGGPGVGGIAGDALGNLGLPTEAQLIAGLTDFMVERAKDEVAFSFVLNLRSQIRNDPWIQAGLPRSFQLMQKMDAETYQVFFPVLRAAFLEDLNQMPARADTLAAIAGGTRSNYVRGLMIAYQRGLEIRQGSPPAVALANLVSVDTLQMPDPIARRALHVTGLVAREYSAGGGEPFVNEVTRADRGWLRRYLVGFLAHDVASDPSLRGDTSRDDLLRFFGRRESDVVMLVNQLHGVRALVNQAREEAGRLDGGADGEQDAKDRVLSTAGAVLQVMNTGQQFLFWGNEPEPQEARDFRQFVADAATLHQAFVKRDYGSLVTWVMQRPELLPCREGGGDERSAVRAAVWKDVEDGKLRSRTGSVHTRGPEDRDPLFVLREIENRLQADRSACARRLKYLSFAASLASARTDREVTVALRTASAPVGSFRAKRNQFEPRDERDRTSVWSGTRWSPKSVSVVGYLGLTAGLEDESRLPPNSTDAVHFGAALPVGFEISTGFPKGALSLFVPLLDLGTLASVRIGDGDTEVSDPTFKQVLAPGGFLVWNATRTIPLSLGVGVQAVPELRERDGDRVGALRLSTFVGVDATLFNFRF